MTRRMVAVWWPDWPVVAAGCAGEPAAVFSSNRVVACSASARAQGVRRGIRRREAQARCPELIVLPHDQARDARAFEPFVTALQDVTPTAEILRPGLCVFAARGPSRYFGGDEALARHITGLFGTDVRAGVAEGVFAAVQAARRGLVVESGRTSEFLAPLPLTTLERPELAGLLERLGIRTLGGFAALPLRDVLGRFGTDGAALHAWAGGYDDRVLRPAPPPAQMLAATDFDDPVQTTGTAAFAARALAGELCDRLAREALACVLLRIEATTAGGASLVRLWRDEVGFSAQAMAQRVRWQLDGWLASRDKPSGPLTSLALVAVETGPNTGVQDAMWGPTSGGEPAAKAIARVQAMLGAEGVCAAVESGGRDPSERYQLTAWGRQAEPARSPAAPWPGRLPEPAPSVLHNPAVPARVFDAHGELVGVGGRGRVGAEPHSILMGGRRLRIVAWAGPWPCDERWWDPDAKRRRARFQIVCEDGSAYLLSVVSGVWGVEGSYE